MLGTFLKQSFIYSRYGYVCISVGKYLLFCRTHYKFETIYVCSPEQIMCRNEGGVWNREGGRGGGKGRGEEGIQGMIEGLSR
jgi:hypothetical protein